MENIEKKAYKGNEFEVMFMCFLLSPDDKERNMYFTRAIKPTIDEMLKVAFFKFGKNRSGSSLEVEPISLQLQKDISQEVYEQVLNKVTKQKLFEIKSLNKYIVTIVFNTLRMNFRKSNTYSKHMNKIQNAYEDHIDAFGLAYDAEPMNKKARLDRELSDYRANIDFDNPSTW